MARRLMLSLMTSRDYDVILVRSQYSKSSHLETGTQINYLCGRFNHTLSYCVKNQLIRLRTLGEEASDVNLPQVKITNNQYCYGDERVAN